MLRLITAATDPVVTLTEAKAHLRVDHDDDDTLITALIAAATARLDGAAGMLGRCLAPQTWLLGLAAFPEGGAPICLPLPPTIEVVSVAWLDQFGVSHTLDTSAYRVIDGGAEGHEIRAPLATPFAYQTAPDTPDAVRVTFRAGYASVPAALKQALLLTLADWYDNRGSAVIGASVAPLPTAADHLIAQYRTRWMG